MFSELKDQDTIYNDLKCLYSKFRAGVGFLNRQMARCCDIRADRVRFEASVVEPMDMAYAALTDTYRAKFAREVGLLWVGERG